MRQAADADDFKALFMAISNVSRQQVPIMKDCSFPNINRGTNESDTVEADFRDLVVDSYVIQHVKPPVRENKLYIQS
jgi:hypothetical protein